MNYINTYKRKLVNSVNQLSKHKLIFDFDTTEEYEFKILDKEGKQIELNETDEFYICGSLKNSAEDTIFFSRDFYIVGNVLSFKINGNTTEFWEKVVNRSTNIFIEISRKTTDDQSFNVILMDEAVVVRYTQGENLTSK